MNYSTINDQNIPHKIMLVNVKNTYKNKGTDDLYLCTRRAWRADLARAQKVDFVIPFIDSKLLAVYKPLIWKHDLQLPERICFEGEEVLDKAIIDLYVGKIYTGSLSQNPVRYINI